MRARKFNLLNVIPLIHIFLCMFALFYCKLTDMLYYNPDSEILSMITQALEPIATVILDIASPLLIGLIVLMVAVFIFNIKKLYNFVSYFILSILGIASHFFLYIYIVAILLVRPMN